MRMKNIAQIALTGTVLTTLSGCSYFSFTYTDLSAQEFERYKWSTAYLFYPTTLEYRGSDKAFSYFLCHTTLCTPFFGPIAFAFQ